MNNFRPTDAELEILNVLWELGPSTVRAVHDHLSNNREVGYTTILKLMQIMAEKKIVTRDESQRSHVYHVAATKEETQSDLLADLATRVFGGSYQELAMQALANHTPNEEELRAIEKLIRAQKKSQQ